MAIQSSLLTQVERLSRRRYYNYRWNLYGISSNRRILLFSINYRLCSDIYNYCRRLRELLSKTFDSYRLYPVSTTITESPELTAGTSEPVEEAPDTEVTEVTGGLEFAFKELVSGIGLTAKLSTEDLHFYSSADSSTEIEATVELISAPKGKTTIGATLPEGEYNVTVSPEGYVSQELGSYTTAENAFLGSCKY